MDSMKRFYIDNLNLKITIPACFGFCKTSKPSRVFYFEVYGK